jgi:hypothetical protein
MSSRSSHVPSTAIDSSVARRSSSQRFSDDAALISTAERRPLESGTRRGRAERESSKASPSDGAGSVEATSTRSPWVAASILSAAAQVVLPTPHLPPMK